MKKDYNVVAVQKLVKRGNSVMVLLPQPLLERYSMVEGDNVLFIETEYGLLICKNGLDDVIVLGDIIRLGKIFEYLWSSKEKPEKLAD